MLENCDLLIITTTDIESSALLVAADDIGFPHKGLCNGSLAYYEFGKIGGVCVAMTRSEMGSVTLGGAQFTTMKAIEERKPKAIIMVGIAFGFYPDNQKIGEILVSKQIQQYDFQKVGTSSDGEQEAILRGVAVPATIDLFKKLKYAGDILKKKHKVSFGMIVSGEKLIDNTRYRNQILNLCPSAIGGEMEGAGLSSAAYGNMVPWILVKAICDFADGKKRVGKKEKQKIAAKASADFLMQAINMGLFSNNSKPPKTQFTIDTLLGEILPPGFKSLVTRPYIFKCLLSEQVVTDHLLIYDISIDYINQYLEELIQAIGKKVSTKKIAISKSVKSILERAIAILSERPDMLPAHAIWESFLEDSVAVIKNKKSSNEWLVRIRQMELEKALCKATPYPNLEI